MGEALEKSQLQPTELADEWEEDHVALAMAAAHELINRGETEDETRKRALKAHTCFMEAVQFYKQALMKWKDPRTCARLVVALPFSCNPFLPCSLSCNYLNDLSFTSVIACSMPLRCSLNFTHFE
jgi:hypothetical protein